MEIVAWQVYVAVGIFFILAEIFVSGFIMAPVGIAALLTAPVSLLVESVAVQLFLLGIFSIVAYLALAPAVRRLIKRSRDTTPIGLTGQSGAVEKLPQGPGHPGSVKVYGDMWEIIWDESDPAYTKMLQELTLGAQVRIVAVEGNRVRIARI
jgi:membrane protein implicated in regulation of membrane protease activity